LRDPDDYFSPWGVSACATPTAMHTATPKSRPVQDLSCTDGSVARCPARLALASGAARGRAFAMSLFAWRPGFA